MNETKYWTWHMLAGVVILILLGIHMITMHLDEILGWFNPAGGAAIDWGNVLARGRVVIYAVFYILLLAAALYHGLYGFRTILFELGPKPGLQRLLNVLFLVVGMALFVFGTWAAVKFNIIARVA